MHRFLFSKFPSTLKNTKILYSLKHDSKKDTEKHLWVINITEISFHSIVNFYRHTMGTFPRTDFGLVFVFLLIGYVFYSHYVFSQPTHTYTLKVTTQCFHLVNTLWLATWSFSRSSFLKGTDLRLLATNPPLKLPLILEQHCLCDDSPICFRQNQLWWPKQSQ